MKKTLLIATPHFPYPIYGGGHVALFNEIDALRSICKVVYACPYASKDHIEKLKHIWPDVEFHILSTEKEIPHISHFNAIKKILLPEKKETEHFYLQKSFFESFFSILYDINESWMQFLQTLIQDTKCDIIQTEFYPVLNNVLFFPKEITKIFIHHEIGFVKMERNIALTGFSGNFMKIITENLMKNEVMMLNQYDKVITLSENDKNALINAGVKSVLSSPFPYIPYKKDNVAFEYNRKLVFIGLESNYANLEGLIWFINEIWPEITAIDKDTELQIIGIWSKKTIRKLTGKNIIFLGYVDKLEETIQNSISIVPIRICSGLRVKIMETVSNNVPVISTSVGAEGLPLSELPGVFIADNASAFIKKIEYIKQHKTEVNSFLSISRNTIKDNYSKERFFVVRKEIMKID